MSLEDKLYKYLNIYKQLPDWAKQIVVLPFSVFGREKYLGETYKVFSELAYELQNSTKEQIYEFQYHKIKQLLEYAYKNVPYYTEKWNSLGIDINQIKSLDDFSKMIPFVTKTELQENPHRFLSKSYLKSDYLQTNSGGSTGVPLDLYYLKGHTRMAERAFWDYYFGTIGFKTGDRIARLRGDFIGKGKVYSYDPYRNTLILSSFSLSSETINEFFKALRKYKIKYITAYPSSIAYMIELSNQETIDLPYLEGVMLGSENVYEPQVKRIKKFFKIDKVFSGYGHGEATIAAGTCSHEFNYHFHPAYGYVEFIKPTNNEKYELKEIQEIVGTSFTNPLMPLIRYKSNDFGVELMSKCSCGSHHKGMSQIFGREQEIAIGRNNEKITLTALVFGRHCEYFTKVSKMQIVNTAPGQLVVRVIPKETFNEKHQLEIVSSLSDKEGMPFKTQVELVNYIPPTKRGKHRFLIREF